MAVKKLKTKKKSKSSFIIGIAIFALSIFTVFSFANVFISYQSKKDELEKLEQKYEEVQQQEIEMSEIFEDLDSYREKVAREEYGYKGEGESVVYIP